MGKFLMICYVAADFTNSQGDIFRVTPGMIGTFIEAPEWIKNTLIFRWLINDGSIKVADEQITKKQGENDPMKGMSAEGKKAEVSEKAEEKLVEEVKAEDAEEVKEPVKKPRAKRTAKKGDAE